MSHQAEVTSIDALETFRVALIKFVTDGRRNLGEVTDTINRTRMWVQSEQRLFWEREVRRAEQKLDFAQQELMSARMSGLRDSTLMQENAVRRAKHDLAFAGEKLRCVKRWARDFDHAIEPLCKQLEGFAGVLGNEMPKALAFLVQAQKTLESYADVPSHQRRTQPDTPDEDEKKAGEDKP